MSDTALLSTDPFGLDAALPSFGAAHRASVSRGLSFVLLLAMSCLIAVYAPLAWPDPGPAGRGRPVHAVQSAAGAGLPPVRILR